MEIELKKCESLAEDNLNLGREQKEIIENFEDSFIATEIPYDERNCYPYNVHPHIQESMKEFLIAALQQQKAGMQSDLNSVINMLGMMENDVDRQKIINFIKEYLIER